MRDLIIECMNWKIENSYMKSRMSKSYGFIKGNTYWKMFFECDEMSDKELLKFYECFLRLSICKCKE